MEANHIIVRKFGGLEVLEFERVDACEPAQGHVSVRILTAGVSYADLLMREGVHPEKTTLPLTPGWDFVGLVDKLGSDVSLVSLGQMVVGLSIHGGYSQNICISQSALVPVPEDVDPGRAVSLVLNYMTAYQMMHRVAHARQGQRALVHAAAGGIGTALLQLGTLVGLEMYGTAKSEDHTLVKRLGGAPIDYERQDFGEEISRLTGDGVDIVFDGIGGETTWRSFKTLRPGGRLIAFGLTSSLTDGRLSEGLRFRYHGLARILGNMIIPFILPGRKRILPYSIQNLQRFKPDWFREDLTVLFELLKSGKINPMIAERIPLEEARRAHEMLGEGGVRGKLVLICD